MLLSESEEMLSSLMEEEGEVIALNHETVDMRDEEDEGVDVMNDGESQRAAGYDSDVDRTESRSPENARKMDKMMEDSGMSLQTAITMSSDDEYAAAGGLDGAVAVWEISTGKCIFRCRPDDEGPGSRTLTEGTRRRGGVGPERLRTIRWMSFAPGRSGEELVCGTDCGRVIWFNTRTGEFKMVGEGHHVGVVREIKYSRDGKYLASICMDRQVRLWDGRTLELVQMLEGGHDGPLRTMAWSEDSERLAASNFDFSVQVWQVSTGIVKSTMKGHVEAVWTMSFEKGNQGRRLVTGSEDGTARIWDSTSGELLMKTGELGGSVWSIFLSEDGDRICAGLMNGTGIIVNAYDGKEMHRLTGGDIHQFAVNTPAYAQLSPDGRKVIVGCGPFVALFDSISGEMLGRKVELSDIVTKLIFSHDGKRVGAIGEDGRMRSWLLTDFV